VSELYRLLLGVLCVWRVTHLIQAEDGPWNVMAGLRRAAGGGLFGQLMDCFYCLSLWVSAPLAWSLGTTLTEQALLWPALSGAAILLERATVSAAAPPASYFEEGNLSNGVLRRDETAGVAERGFGAERDGNERQLNV
jgi:hypothetical protein